MNDIIPTKELEVYRHQLDTAEKFGLSLEVKTDTDYHDAFLEAKTIKEHLEMITKRKEEITKPLNATLKSVRNLFKPLEDRLEASLNIIKTKMLGFTEAKEAKMTVKNDKIDARLEKGTISEAQAEVKKFINQVPKSVATEAGTATTKKIKTYVVVDISQVPIDFLEVNLIKVRASFKSGFPVPGVEERLVNSLAIN